MPSQAYLHEEASSHQQEQEQQESSSRRRRRRRQRKWTHCDMGDSDHNDVGRDGGGRVITLAPTVYDEPNPTPPIMPVRKRSLIADDPATTTTPASSLSPSEMSLLLLVGAQEDSVGSSEDSTNSSTDSFNCSTSSTMFFNDSTASMGSSFCNHYKKNKKQLTGILKKKQHHQY